MNFNFRFDWGNATGTARWNHVFGPKLFSNATFTDSDYQYNIQNILQGFSFNLEAISGMPTRKWIFTTSPITATPYVSAEISPTTTLSQRA
jgi:hypothetical protein